ncbi:hypothetical protein IWQ61_003130 [Dispira simplex]|nr:hypothetical protein IWQ61_003130 [Dispira simplex]
MMTNAATTYEYIQLDTLVLANLTQEFANALGDTEGFLFGEPQLISNGQLTTDANARAIIRVLGYRCWSPVYPRFYDATGKIHTEVLKNYGVLNQTNLVGYFKFRRNVTGQPALRDQAVFTNLRRILPVNSSENQSSNSHFFAFVNFTATTTDPNTSLDSRTTNGSTDNRLIDVGDQPSYRLGPQLSTQNLSWMAWTLDTGSSTALKPVSTQVATLTDRANQLRDETVIKTVSPSPLHGLSLDSIIGTLEPLDHSSTIRQYEEMCQNLVEKIKGLSKELDTNDGQIADIRTRLEKELNQEISNILFNPQFPLVPNDGTLSVNSLQDVLLDLDELDPEIESELAEIAEL